MNTLTKYDDRWMTGVPGIGLQNDPFRKNREFYVFFLSPSCRQVDFFRFFSFKKIIFRMFQKILSRFTVSNKNFFKKNRFFQVKNLDFASPWRLHRNSDRQILWYFVLLGIDELAHQV